MRLPVPPFAIGDRVMLIDMVSAPPTIAAAVPPGTLGEVTWIIGHRMGDDFWWQVDVAYCHGIQVSHVVPNDMLERI